MGLLSLAIWLPIVTGTALLALTGKERAGTVRWLALLASVASFVITLPLITGFDSGTALMQFEENAVWFERFNVRYHLGIDGLSLWFVPLTAFITVIVVVAGWEVIQERVNEYMGAFLILSGMMVGVFTALDGMLFYVFFESTLIPMYLIIGIWGGPRRFYAAFKFFLFTVAGSLVMLVAMIYLYYQSGGSFDIQTWHRLPLAAGAQTWIFFAFFLAFAVKVPMWPIHTWLPDAHVEAPTGGSVVLAAIMLKLGAYGFLRFSMPITPDASHEWAGVMIALSLIAIVYIGLVALVQRDMKKLVAYSSVAHMGFVTFGFFLFNPLGVAGGIVQMIAHGFVSGAMFLCIGVLYDRLHTREISAYGGVTVRMPMFASFAVLFAMANCGLPGTAGFVGEWMVILGGVQTNFWLGALAATALISGAAYTLWMIKRIYFGPVANEHVQTMNDLNLREFAMLTVMAVAVLWMGLYPKPFTDTMNVSVAELLRHVAISKIAP